MFGIGGGELIIVFLIILFLFGAKKLPEMARAMGKSVNEFKKAKSEVIDAMDINSKNPETKTAQSDKKEQTPVIKA